MIELQSRSIWLAIISMGLILIKYPVSCVAK